MVVGEDVAVTADDETRALAARTTHAVIVATRRFAARSLTAATRGVATTTRSTRDAEAPEEFEERIVRRHAGRPDANALALGGNVDHRRSLLLHERSKVRQRDCGRRHARAACGGRLRERGERCTRGARSVWLTRAEDEDGSNRSDAATNERTSRHGDDPLHGHGTPRQREAGKVQGRTRRRTAADSAITSKISSGTLPKRR